MRRQGAYGDRADGMLFCGPALLFYITLIAGGIWKMTSLCVWGGLCATNNGRHLLRSWALLRKGRERVSGIEAA